MATRRYISSKRTAQLSQRQQRVVAATVELHAEIGPIETSYADIAQRAGVSLPTVYSYFPSQAALMGACTGHVAAGAPSLPVEAIVSAPDLRAGAEILVVSMDKLHTYFEPWASWRAERTIPYLGELRITNRERLTTLLLQFLSRHGKEHPAYAAAWESLLSFDLWHRLVRQHALPRARVRALLVDLLLSALGPQSATATSPGPRRRP